MESSFSTLVNTFIENNVGISENFLGDALSADLRNNLLNLYSNNRLQLAGTGSNGNLKHNQLLRSDVIYWLDRDHDDVHENSFFSIMDDFVVYLNETCYTGITSYEFHYALYETGSFYKTHIDQFQGNTSRKYSMIMYLNESWIEADGGELQIHHRNLTQTISPTNGKSVFFKSSELPHEVLTSNKPRLSITGWLKS